MKTLLLTLLVLPFLMSAKTQVERFRFVEAKSFNVLESLPPKIELTLDIMCNDELVEVIHHEWTHPLTKKVSIAVGAFVHEDKSIKCGGKKKEIKAMAGHSFSGKDHEITKIRSLRY